MAGTSLSGHVPFLRTYAKQNTELKQIVFQLDEIKSEDEIRVSFTLCLAGIACQRTPETNTMTIKGLVRRLFFV